MYYCGLAVHTLFISCTRMAGDNDFIKSGKVGGWVWGNWHSESVYRDVHIFFCMFMNLHTICLAREMAAGMKWKTNSIPSALN